MRKCTKESYQALMAVVCATSSLGSSLSFQAPAQAAQSIRKIFVDAFQGKHGSTHLREKVVERLRENGKFALVSTALDADAVVHGSGDIWVRGHVSLNPHATSSMRQTVYGGYLSIEVKSPSGETVWSYLVTPSRMHWSGVEQDMADRIVKLMVAALAQASPAGIETSTQGSQVTLAGAGSTFAAPLYQDWIELFEKRHPEIRVPVSRERKTCLLHLVD